MNRNKNQFPEIKTARGEMKIEPKAMYDD